MSEPFEWDDKRKYDRGKVLDAKALDEVEKFGRYVDVDGDGIGQRTLPGTHPEKGAFFTRGTSRDEYAIYTESPEIYERNMQRLLKKWETAATLVPPAEVSGSKESVGIIYYGTSMLPMQEALDRLAEQGIRLDTMRIRSFPFGKEVWQFIAEHDFVFVVEQNRDAQMKTLLVNEGGLNPANLVEVLYYAGLSISADFIADAVATYFDETNRPKLTEVTS